MSKTEQKELRLSIILGYITLFANVAGSLFVTPFLIYHFGTAEYGLYMLAYSVGMYVSVDGMGIGGMVIRQVKKHLTLGEEGEQKSFLFQSLLIFAILAAIAYAIVRTVGICAGVLFAGSVEIENIRRLQWMINFTAGHCVLMFLFNYIISVVTGYGKLIFVKAAALVKIVLRTAAVVVMSGTFSVEALVYLDVGLTSVMLLATVLYAFRALRIRFSLRVEWSKFRAMLGQTGYIFVSLVSDNVCWNSGSLLVGMFFGEASAGVFSIAMTLCGVFSQLSASISGLFLPSITALVVSHASPKALLDGMIKTGRYLMALLVLVVVGFGLAGREFLVMYLGEDFLPAYAIALPLMIALLYPSTQMMGDSVIQAMNKFNMRSTIQLLSSVLTVGLGVWLIPLLGLEGSWVGLVVSVVIFRIFVTNFFLEKLGLNMRAYFLKTVPRMALIVAVLVPALLACFAFFAPGFFLKCLMIALAYAVAAWFLYFNREERALLPAFFGKGTKR